MATQLTTTMFNFDGTEVQSVSTAVVTDAYAAAWFANGAEDWDKHGWRNELFQLNDRTSVQCMYDSQGCIWKFYEYTRMDEPIGGYVDTVSA